MDREALAEALGLDEVTPLAGVHSEWIEVNGPNVRYAPQDVKAPGPFALTSPFAPG